MTISAMDDPSTCTHPTASVFKVRTFKAKGREWTEQKLRCVDCGEVCETNIF
jgi:hypothetical protein